MAALRLEDLIQAQNKLAQKEQQAPERMSMDDLKQMSKELSDDKTPKTTKSILKKSLQDKTGDGLNSNVIKLTKVISDSVKAKGSVVGSQVADRVVKESKDVEKARIEAASKEGAGKAQIGGVGFLKEEFKKLGSLKGWFDLGEGKSKGMLGQALRRKQDQNQYVKDQMAANPNMKNLAQFGGDEGKVRDYWKGKRKEQQEVFRKQAENEKVISGLQKRGYSEKEIERGGFIKTRRELDDQRAEVDARYKKQRDAARLDEKPIKISSGKEQSNVVSIDRKAKSKAKTDEANPLSVATGSSETEAENLRLMASQTQAIVQIEENTRSLRGVNLAALGGTAAVVASETGGGLGGMLGTGGVLKGITGGISRAAGGLTKGAGGLIKGIGGKALGAIGGAAMGAYDAYTGYSNAAAQQEAGLITADQADVKKTAAISGGVGGAGGAMAGAAAGAALGSVVPVVGTAIGGIVGGALGYYGGSEVGKTAGEYGAKAYKGIKGMFGGDANRVVPVSTTGVAEAANAMTPKVMVSAVAPAPMAADAVYNKSSENAAAGKAAQAAQQAPIIVNSPTTVSNTQNQAVRSPTRNTDSSYQNYQRSKYAMA